MKTLLKKLSLQTCGLACLIGLSAASFTNVDPSTQKALAVAKALDLSGHIEGGFFKRTYQANDADMINTEAGDRYLMTSIFYMLTKASPTGHFHLNKSDIVHYYHLGDPILYTLIHPDGTLEEIIMGPDVVNRQRLQLTVKGGVWKASSLLPGSEGFGLISEAVTPGFDYADMTLGTETILKPLFPEHWLKIRDKIKAH